MSTWLAIYYFFSYIVFGYTLAIMTSYLFFVFLSWSMQIRVKIDVPDDDIIKYQLQGSPLTPAVTIIAPA